MSRSGTGLRQIGVLLCALQMGLVSPHAWALAPGDTTEEPATEKEAPDTAPDDATAEAVRLYNQGVARFRSADYEGAIDAFSQALEVLTAVEGDTYVQAGMLENLARAQAKAFDVDGDVQRLRAACEIYERLLGRAEYFQLTKEDEERLRTRLEEVEKALEEAERPPEPAAAEPVQKKPVAKPVVDRPPDKRWRGLTISGAVLTGVGACLGGGMVAGLVLGERANDKVSNLETLDEEEERMDEYDRGLLYNKLAIGMGVAGGVVLVTGVALLAVGQARKRRSRRVALMPVLGPHTLGGAATLRF
jgi:tetratricopeptide (TPR) repeat protein